MKTKILFISMALLATLACTSEYRPHHRVARKHVRLHVLAGGRYCFHDDSADVWWYYTVASDSGSSPQPVYGNLPRGGSWTSSKNAPDKEEPELEEEFELEEVDNNPATETEAAAAEASDAAADSSSASDSSSGSSNSGSSNSGGGNGGGGNGGGGNGGE